MRDQAEKLRQLVRDEEESRASSTRRSTRIVAITSGKGGVGKTNLAVNIGIALIELGARVALMDADLGLANVDVLLGLMPDHTLKDALTGSVSMLDIICPGPGDLQVIPGGSGVQELADLSEEKLDGFISSLQEIEALFDYILIDTGAGISRTVTSFLYAADQVLLVTTPEPTSITDAYAMIKTMLQHIPEIKLSLIINRAANLGDAQETHRKLEKAVQSFLGSELTLMGWIVDDPVVPRSVRAHKPLLLFAPDSAVSRHIRLLARNLHQNSFTLDGVEADQSSEAGVTGFFARLRSIFGHK